MDVKGVCYDAGREMMGACWRPEFDKNTVTRELEIIRNDLHASAVRICGKSLERLEFAGEAALSMGLEVWFSPEMWDRPQDETIRYLVEAAGIAEQLRLRHQGHIVFSLGSEMSLFMQGILEGENVFERMRSPSFLKSLRSGVHNTILNRFLETASARVREHFRGPLTYFSLPLERVQWENFDFVGVDLYRDENTRGVFGQLASSYLKYGKPLIIGETGCCTYLGAEKLGGSGFTVSFVMMERYLGKQMEAPVEIPEMLRAAPEVDGHFIRDEALQAREVVEQLDILDAAGATGAFVFTFVSQNSPHNPDPRCDMDMAGFSLVKSYPDEKTVEKLAVTVAAQIREFLKMDIPVEDIMSFFGNVGKHGATYPEMPWEPKESFRSVSKFYLGH